MNNEIKVGDQYITENGYFCAILTVSQLSKEFAICDAVRLRDGAEFEQAVYFGALKEMGRFTGELKEKAEFLAKIIADADVNTNQAEALYDAGYRKVSKDE